MTDLEYSAMSQEQLLLTVQAKDAEIERLKTGLREIAANRNMTLMVCSPDTEYGITSTHDEEKAHELGAYKAFNQCADIAEATLKEADDDT